MASGEGLNLVDVARQNAESLAKYAKELSVWMMRPHYQIAAEKLTDQAEVLKELNNKLEGQPQLREDKLIQ